MVAEVMTMMIIRRSLSPWLMLSGDSFVRQSLLSLYPAPGANQNVVHSSFLNAFTAAHFARIQIPQRMYSEMRSDQIRLPRMKKKVKDEITIGR